MSADLKTKLLNNIKDTEQFCKEHKVSKEDAFKAHTFECLACLVEKVGQVLIHVRSIDKKLKDQCDGKGKTIIPLG